MKSLDRLLQVYFQKLSQSNNCDIYMNFLRIVKGLLFQYSLEKSLSIKEMEWYKFRFLASWLDWI